MSDVIKPEDVPKELVDAITKDIGLKPIAWDCPKPERLVAAILNAAIEAGLVTRRIPDADDPRVLMEALKDLHETALTYAGFDAIGPLEGRIDQARRELESEGNDDQA